MIDPETGQQVDYPEGAIPQPLQSPIAPLGQEQPQLAAPAPAPEVPSAPQPGFWSRFGPAISAGLLAGGGDSAGAGRIIEIARQRQIEQQHAQALQGVIGGLSDVYKHVSNNDYDSAINAISDLAKNNPVVTMSPVAAGALLDMSKALSERGRQKNLGQEFGGALSKALTEPGQGAPAPVGPQPSPVPSPVGPQAPAPGPSLTAPQPGESMTAGAPRTVEPFHQFVTRQIQDGGLVPVTSNVYMPAAQDLASKVLAVTVGMTAKYGELPAQIKDVLNVVNENIKSMAQRNSASAALLSAQHADYEKVAEDPTQGTLYIDKRGMYPPQLVTHAVGVKTGPGEKYNVITPSGVPGQAPTVKTIINTPMTGPMLSSDDAKYLTPEQQKDANMPVNELAMKWPGIMNQIQKGKFNEQARLSQLETINRVAATFKEQNLLYAGVPAANNPTLGDFRKGPSFDTKTGDVAYPLTAEVFADPKRYIPKDPRTANTLQYAKRDIWVMDQLSNEIDQFLAKNGGANFLKAIELGVKKKAGVGGYDFGRLQSLMAAGKVASARAEAGGVQGIAKILEVTAPEQMFNFNDTAATAKGKVQAVKDLMIQNMQNELPGYKYKPDQTPATGIVGLDKLPSGR